MRHSLSADAANGFIKPWLSEGASAELEGAQELQSASLAAMSAPAAPRLSNMSVAFDVLVLLEFDAALPFSPLPAIKQFTVKVNGVTAKVQKVSVAENGHTLVLTLAEPVKAGATVSVAYADVSANDDKVTLQGMNGADVADFQAQTKVDGVVEDKAPKLESASVAFDELVLLKFDRPLATKGLPAIKQFTVKVDGVAAKIAKVSVAEDGHTFVLTLSKPVKAGATVSVAYADVSANDDKTTLQGADGADVANFETQAKAESEQGPPPQLQSMSVAFGELVLLDFDAPLPFEPVPAIKQFTVKVNGVVAKVAGVSVAENGHTLVLTLETPVKNGAVVTVAYADVSAQDDDVTLQGMDGADVADFQAQATAQGGPGQSAPQLQSMTVRGDQVTLKFDADLSAQDLPAAGQFTVQVGGVRILVTKMVVGEGGDVLVLTLATPVAPGANVSLAYADISAADDDKTLQGEDGTDVANFQGQAQAGGAAPVFETMTVRGDKVTLAFDAALASQGLPSVDQFTLTVDGAELQIESLALSEDGHSLVLTLAEPVKAGDAVSLSYADLTSGDDPATLQGTDGADVSNFEADGVALADAPTMSAMTVRGDRVTLKFDGPVSAEHLPSLDQFKVSIGDAEVAVASLSVSESGDVVTLQLAKPAGEGKQVKLVYKDVSDEDDETTLQSRDGADVADFEAEAAALAVGQGPAVVEAIAQGATVRLVLDQLLDPAHLPKAESFAVKVAGNLVEVVATSIGAGEHELVLTLKAPAGFGQAVTVSYTDPTAGDDALALQNAGGADADSFQALPVENLTAPAAPVLQSATVSGASLVLTYDVALDASHGPDRAMFWVHVNGEQVAVSGVSVSGKAVTLSLGQAVTSAQTVKVSYFDNTFGEDDDYGVQSRDGADAATVLDRAVVHRSSASFFADAQSDLSLVGQSDATDAYFG